MWRSVSIFAGFYAIVLMLTFVLCSCTLGPGPHTVCKNLEHVTREVCWLVGRVGDLLELGVMPARYQGYRYPK